MSPEFTTKSILKLLTDMHNAYIQTIDTLVARKEDATALDVKKEFITGHKLVIALFTNIAKTMEELE